MAHGSRLSLHSVPTGIFPAAMSTYRGCRPVAFQIFQPLNLPGNAAIREARIALGSLTKCMIRKSKRGSSVKVRHKRMNYPTGFRTNL
ncbi:hypothetical protein DNTS_009244 [Danionella cerebrum]|uniref:Uncharacterized protein n=1 Tax=Danionella cerebrum TaxID=2873325 RepID=A0A553Q5L8_9TELE|nr:hypothetical protein DNTS_009244 [Danionella translucida]